MISAVMAVGVLAPLGNNFWPLETSLKLVLLFIALPLSSFGGPGHPLNTAAIGDHMF
jgi:hypothetical protein